MKNRALSLLVVVAIGAFIIAQTCLFMVRETETAIVILLGEPKTVITEAGLNLKNPLANVVKLDKRNLEYDLAQVIEVTDVNQERLTVDAFVRYRIVSPQTYYERFRAEGESAAALKRAGQNSIDGIMQASLRQTLGEVSIADIVTNLRATLMRRIADRMSANASEFGVQIIDVKIRRADYPDDIAVTVYNQMSSARKETAQLIRSEGTRESTEIEADANRRRVEIVADAQRKALQIKGEADATRNCILAGAYDGVAVEVLQPNSVDADGADDGGVDASAVRCKFLDGGRSRDQRRAEFFAFYRSLEAYENSLQGGNTSILLSPDSEFFKYFNELNVTP